jgi:prepilin-type N-terminal cleavage/methylation domain-containing protein
MSVGEALERFVFQRLKAGRRCAGQAGRVGPLGEPDARAGFTITELLVSMVIISIGVVGFASAVGVMSKELWYGNRDTRVAMLVGDQLEKLKALPYDSVQSGTRSEGAYQLTWQVQGADPKKVILVVGYPGGKGQARADTVVSFIPR